MRPRGELRGLTKREEAADGAPDGGGDFDPIRVNPKLAPHSMSVPQDVKRQPNSG